MKSRRLPTNALLGFLAAIALYLAIFYGIEHRRVRNGPWRVAFENADGAGTPMLIVNEPSLKISNLRIRFPGQSAPQTNAVLIFDRAQEVPYDVPFGQCVFQDVLFQPGTVVFSLFGHEIQLLPRALTIDKKEHPWRSETALEVRP
jgi:hypothetical protein